MAPISADTGATRGDADSSKWWEAIGSGELRLPTCGHCKRKWFPPSPTCPHCGASDHTLESATGRGTVYSWVVVHRTLDPEFVREAPYVIAAIDLDEGVRIVGRLFGESEDGEEPPRVPAALSAGADVRAVFYGPPDRRLLGWVAAR